jgi:signal transduction histidine kinase
LNIKPVRVDGLIQTVVKVFQQLSSSKEFEVLIDLPPELPPALADENRLVQILYNLIGNAVKFTKQGYVKVSAKVTVTSVSKVSPAIIESEPGKGARVSFMIPPEVNF